MPPPAKSPAQPTVWEDQITSKFHIVDNETGARIPCDRSGTKLLPKFIPGLSGVATTSDRMARLAEVGHMKMPAAASGDRPGPLDAELRQQRAVTKGRFGTKHQSEIDLFLHEQRVRREQFPEIEAKAREEEAVARAKIDELHKNYLALAASTKAGNVAKVKEQIDPKTLPMSRSEMWAFTATGGFRP
jgi:hypothetical protein